MKLSKQFNSLFRLLPLVLVGLILFAQFHTQLHDLEHQPDQTCEHCLAGHDNESALAVLGGPEPLVLAQQEIEQIATLIYKSQSPVFHHPQSRAPPVS